MKCFPKKNRRELIEHELTKKLLAQGVSEDMLDKIYLHLHEANSVSKTDQEIALLYKLIGLYEQWASEWDKKNLKMLIETVKYKNSLDKDIAKTREISNLVCNYPPEIPQSVKQSDIIAYARLKFAILHRDDKAFKDMVNSAMNLVELHLNAKFAHDGRKVANGNLEYRSAQIQKTKSRYAEIKDKWLSLGYPPVWETKERAPRGSIAKMEREGNYKRSTIERAIGKR